MIPIRYQQLVLFPCCSNSREIHPNIIHIFGNLRSESKEDEERLKQICKHTRASMDWKATLISDQAYSYLPYNTFESIDNRTYIYQKWKTYVPIEDLSMEEAYQYLEMKIRTSNDHMFLCWMYNVIVSTRKIARSYDECILCWCNYIRMNCPCSDWIHDVLATHHSTYVPYDQWIILYKEDFTKNKILHWKTFCENHIQRCYDAIIHSNGEYHFNYMVTLPILWEILFEELRMVKQIFVEDIVHPHLIEIINDWVGQFGCILCSSQFNHVPTSVDYWKNTIIHVPSIHNHMRITLDKDPVVTNTVFPTLEKIENVMDIIPTFMFDSHEIMFEIFS